MTEQERAMWKKKDKDRVKHRVVEKYQDLDVMGADGSGKGGKMEGLDPNQMVAFKKKKITMQTQLSETRVKHLLS